VLEGKKTMKLKSLAAAAALLLSGLAGAAVVTVNAGPYTLSYDNAAASDFVLGAVTASGFEWSFKDVSVQSFGTGLVSKDLLLPQFTVTANTGWNLGNMLSSSVGNVVFFEAGASATTSLTAGGSLSVLGGSTTVLPQTALSKSGTTSGYYFGAASGALNDATAFTVKDVKLVLTANAGAASFAAITAQSQNNLAFAFTAGAVPVPEPESYALLLAGLGAIGLFARRRQPR
jgi:hypothetical protein